MKAVNLITLALVIIGGINWGLVGAFQFDLVAALFGGQGAPLARIVYIAVGISALWQVVPFMRAMRIDEPLAEGTRATTTSTTTRY
jgi:uncharacterized protein